MATTAKKPYPTALPHRAPEDLAAQCDKWRRRTFGVILVGVTALAIAAPAFIYFMNERSAGKIATAPALIVESLPATPMAIPTPISQPEPTLPSVPKRIVLAPPKELIKKSAPPASPAKLDPATAQKEVFLEALGSLSAAHLFQTYLNIGLLADGVESEAYTPAQAEETLLSINEMMDQAETQLEKLTKLGLDAEDNAALEQIRTVAALLRLQSKCLKDYWRSGDMSQAKQYHEARQAAWKGLTKVLQVSGE
jgi:hypothetical protein